MAPLKNTLNMNVGLCHNSPCVGIRDSYYNGLVLNLMVINENEKVGHILSNLIKKYTHVGKQHPIWKISDIKVMEMRNQLFI